MCIIRSVREETTQNVKINANNVSKLHWWESPFLRDPSGVVRTPLPVPKYRPCQPSDIQGLPG